MGVTVLSINDAQTAFQYGVNQAGVYVQSVNEGGAADKAGLQPGDRFVSIDGTAVNSTSDITGIIGEHAVGDTIEVQVVRGTQIVTANVTLEESTPQASSTQRTEGGCPAQTEPKTRPGTGARRSSMLPRAAPPGRFAVF